MFVSLSYTERERERESTAWFKARERKRVALLREYVHMLDKIRKNIFFGFIDYFYHIIDLFNRKFSL